MTIKILNHICLISPKRDTWSKTEKIREVLQKKNKFLKAWYSSSLSILTIAALIPSDIKITFVDEDFEEIDFSVTYDLVGVSAMTQQAQRGYQIASEFRKRGTYVVMGGIHASAMPEEALQYVDTVFIGEAENTWPEFLNDFKNKIPKKIYTQNKREIDDLKSSPIPKYDILKEKNYFKDSRHFYNMIPIQVSRGCPHACEFCLVSDMYGTKFRKKSFGQVKQEISTIKKLFPGKLIMFADDNLFLDRKYSKGLLQVIKELGVRWVAQSDIAVGEDEDLLSLIYESGGLFLLVGFESINPANLKAMNKNSWKFKQLKNYKKYIERIQKHGIIVFGSFIFGLDNDDSNVFRNVVDFMNRNHITGQLTIATPLPGSRMLERLKNENRLLENNSFWEKCTFFDVLFEPKKMKKEELEDGFIWAYNQLFNEKAFIKRAEYLKKIYKSIS